MLKKSLHQAVLLELDKETRPDLIAHPWETVIELPEQQPSALPSGTSVAKLFDQSGRSLLILGEPGSGKTITLLELVCALLDRAETDASQPIPVMLNLSSWGEPRLSFEEWVVAELNGKYQISKKTGWQWLMDFDLILCLDGLDEVAQEHQEGCVQAINVFGEAYGLSGIVVCSRSAEYAALPSRLKMGGAIYLQPLSPQQIMKYFEGLGASQKGLLESLEKDPVLQELAQTPLMLSVLGLAFQDLPPSALGEDELPPEVRRKHIFDRYVRRMFARHNLLGKEESAQMLHWLVWLARNMSQAEFVMEDLQPHQILNPALHKRYQLFLALITLLPLAGLSWLWIRVAVPVFYLENTITLRLSHHLPITGPLFALSFSWLSWCLFQHRFHAKTSLWVGFLATVSITSGLILETGPFFALLAGLVLGGGLSLVLFWFGQRQNQARKTPFGEIETVAVRKFVWPRFLWGGLYGGLFGLFAYLVIAFTILVNNYLSHETLWQFVPRIINTPGFLTFLAWIWHSGGSALVGMSAVFMSMMLGLVGGEIEIDPKAQPNRRIWQSLWNGLRIGGFMFLGVGVQALLIHDPQYPSLVMDWMIWARYFILILGGLIGYVMGLYFGGFAFLQHFLLRVFVWQQRWLPWDVPRFLASADNLIFLRKVGGGYIFIHRLLKEHLVAMGVEHFLKVTVQP